MEYTFYIQNFWAACACPEKQSCPDIFHCIEQVFFIIQKFWVACACPEKQRVPCNFSLYGIYFLHSGVLSNMHALALIFFTVLNMLFLSFRIFEQLALALKNRVAQKVFAVWNILFTFRIFEQLALALKNRGCPEFTILNVFFLLFRIFEQLTLALKNRKCPEIFRCIEYIFYYSEFLSNLRLPWKTELPWNFSLYWNTFYDSGFLRNLRLPWKQSLPWKFLSPGGAAAPHRLPASYAYAGKGCYIWSQKGLKTVVLMDTKQGRPLAL